MTNKKALKILKNFNDWRRGVDGVTIEHKPKEIGLAIDYALDLLAEKQNRIDKGKKDKKTAQI